MRAQLILRLQEDIKGPEKKEIITEQIVELVLSTDKDQFRQMFDNMIAMTIEDTSNRLFGEHGEKIQKAETDKKAEMDKSKPQEIKEGKVSKGGVNGPPTTPPPPAPKGQGKK